MSTLRLAFILLMVVPVLAPTAKLEMAVPAEVQYPLFLKVFALDREFAGQVGDEVVIGVLHQPQVRTSWRAMEAFMKAAAASPVKSVRGRRVRVVPVEMEAPEALAQRLAEQEVDVLYVGPLRAVSIGEVAALARRLRLRTLTGMPSYVDEGLAVGVGLDGDRPEIAINLEAARAEGADFNVQLLRLVRVVKE